MLEATDDTTLRNHTSGKESERTMYQDLLPLVNMSFILIIPASSYLWP